MAVRVAGSIPKRSLSRLFLVTVPAAHQIHELRADQNISVLQASSSAGRLALPAYTRAQPSKGLKMCLAANGAHHRVFRPLVRYFRRVVGIRQAR